MVQSGVGVLPWGAPTSGCPGQGPIPSSVLEHRRVPPGWSSGRAGVRGPIPCAGVPAAPPWGGGRGWVGGVGGAGDGAGGSGGPRGSPTTLVGVLAMRVPFAPPQQQLLQLHGSFPHRPRDGARVRGLPPRPAGPRLPTGPGRCSPTLRSSPAHPGGAGGGCRGEG